MKNCILTLVLLVIAGIGCKLPSSSSNGESNTSSANTEPGGGGGGSAKNTDQFRPGPSPQDDVVTVLRRFSLQDEYQSVADNTEPKGYHAEIEYIAPDRYH